MHKLIFAFLFILLVSCNTNTAPKKDVVIPEKERNMRELIALHPDSFLLKENLIEYFHESKNFGQAINETEKFIATDSTNEQLWDIASRLYVQNEDTIKAIKALEKALEIKADPKYIISLGVIYAQTKNPMAIAMADALLQAPKANAATQAIFIKGLYYYSIGDKNKALEYFSDCISYNYTFVPAYHEKASCYYDLGKYNEAIALIKQGIAVQSDYDELYYLLGRCYEKTGKRQDAIDSYQQALTITPDYVEARDALAKMGIAN